jgi:hypothetical protein
MPNPNYEEKKYYHVISQKGSEKSRVIAKKYDFYEAYYLIKDLKKVNPETNYRLVLHTESVSYLEWI